MVWERGWYELVGISVLDASPLTAVHLRWHPGLLVVYGKNGSGKSTLHDQLASLSSTSESGGRRGQVFLHGHFTPGLEVDVEALVDTFSLGNLVLTAGRAVERAIYSPEGAVLDEVGDPFSLYEEMMSEGDLDAYWSRLVGLVGSAVALGHDYQVDPALAREVADARAFSITPEGHVWLSGTAGESAPLLSQHLREAYRVSGPGGVRLIDSEPFMHSPFYDHRDWPDWAPIPLIDLTEAGDSDPDPTRTIADVISLGRTDADEVTNQAIRLRLDEVMEVTEDGHRALLQLGDDFDNLLTRLQRQANRHYRSFLLEAPTLEVIRLHPRQWLEGRLVRWQVPGNHGAAPLLLNQLSQAQRRWAHVSISLGVSEVVRGLEPDMMMLLLDEPEIALHPKAIEHLRSGLVAKAQQLGGPVLAATHSPVLLAEPLATPLHIQRDALGRATVHPLTHDLRGTLDDMTERLGLNPADLFQTFRVFLIVEGIHDVIVLEKMFPDAWSQAWTHILPMSGAKNLATVIDSELILSFSEAHIVVLLDNTRHEAISQVWDDVRKLAEDGKSAAAHRALDLFRADNPKLSNEERWALDALQSSLNQRPDRIHLHGLSARDIIELFPPRAFGLHESWTHLHAKHDQQVATMRSDTYRRSKPPNFKQWTRTIHGARISKETIRQAALEASEHPPDELAMLLEKCRRLALGLDMLS